MKNLKQSINEVRNYYNIIKASEMVNNVIINRGIEEIPDIIFNLLNKISDNGEDEMIVREIKSWVNQNSRNIRR